MQAFLTDMPKGVELRSVGVRRAEVTAGTFLCSLVRDGLRCSVPCDGVMMDAGSIRRNYVYPLDYTHFTYGDLKKATPCTPPSPVPLFCSAYSTFDTVIAAAGLLSFSSCSLESLMTSLTAVITVRKRGAEKRAFDRLGRPGRV